MKILHNKGFTLVELMIVVAIIGILAAIAVPNYQKYQAKARQAEVKLNMSGAYTALQSYIVENSSYSSCLSAIGVGVGAATEKRYYSFGFATPGAAPLDTFSNGTACPGTGVGNVWFAATVGANGQAATTVPQAGTTVTSASTFTLGAQGMVGTPGVIDTWTMKEDKSLTNTVSGL